MTLVNPGPRAREGAKGAGDARLQPPRSKPHVSHIGTAKRQNGVTRCARTPPISWNRPAGLGDTQRGSALYKAVTQADTGIPIHPPAARSLQDGRASGGGLVQLPAHDGSENRILDEKGNDLGADGAH